MLDSVVGLGIRQWFRLVWWICRICRVGLLSAISVLGRLSGLERLRQGRVERRRPWRLRQHWQRLL